MNEPRFELPKKYSLDKLTPLDENSEKVISIKLKLKTFSEAGIEWPIEMMGGGKSNWATKTFEVSYPVGDIFCSYAVVIHELGHLRQGEIHEMFAVDELGAPVPIEKAEDYHLESERDAYQRGLQRVTDYAPEALNQLEQKFQSFKEQGLLQDFVNFDDFYKYVVRASLRGSELHDSINYGEANTDEDVRSRTIELADLLKGDPVTNDFFLRQEKWKVGELIDRPEIEALIRKVANKVADERYT